MCDKGGKPRDRKNKDLHPSKKRPNTGSRKTDCPYRIIAQEQGEGGTWRGYILEEHHNHEPSDDPIAHPSNRTKKLLKVGNGTSCHVRLCQNRNVSSCRSS